MNQTEPVDRGQVLHEAETLVGELQLAVDEFLGAPHSLPAHLKDTVYDIKNWVELAYARSIGLDPYLVGAVSQAVSDALIHMISGDGDDGDQLHVALERIRQGLIYLVAESDTTADRPVAELAVWLLQSGVDREGLSDLLHVSARTLQRWANGDTKPRAGDTARIQALARTIDNLRHAMTGAGVVMWLTAPHPALDGSAPMSLLDHPEDHERLAALAASTRSTIAA